MEISIITKVANKEEIRFEQTDFAEGENIPYVMEELLGEAINDYSGEDTNWYDNPIITTLTAGDITIIAKVDYSFSSQYLYLEALKDGETIAEESYENNQMDYEWDEGTARAFVFSIEESMEA